MSEKILVVDDDSFILRLVSYILETEGYTVVTAADGREALGLLAEHQPDLVICDISMPELDGFATIEAIRADPETQELPVIMLTSRGQERDMQRAREVSADDYLTKPFSSSQVLESVARHLGRSTK
ncbi:MAG: response regulator [Anaerolineales bacterium]|nr:MAG: response regulator [Anaerolineales bacterium]